MADIGPHWLSFSNSDQQVLRADTRGFLWDSLVVPGTLATYYKQGVGGYVLTRRKPFVIDPRTPLIQPPSTEAAPRASHHSLAAIHNDLIGEVWAQGEEIQQEAWTDELWTETVTRVLDFQAGFEGEAAEKIERYEDILAEANMSLDLSEPIEGPARLIPPYWAVRRTRERWWDLSRAAIEQAVDEHGTQRIMPIVCVATGASPDLFVELIADMPAGLEDVFCWLGSWDESEATPEEIEAWLALIDAAAMRDLRVTNLYGGALSAMMTGLGLAGVSHGVGYSESRDEQRLSQTGAPPMRYYVPRLRRFYPVPRAQRHLDDLQALDGDWRCDCEICGGRETIVGLDTQELKQHFLLCRAAEFRAAREDPAAAIGNLADDAAALMEVWGGEEPDLDRPLGARGRVLSRWAEVLGRRL